jgi:hypothetical protein
VVVKDLGSKALSVRQPFASLLVGRPGVHRRKRVETRSWSTAHRGWLLIHAAAQPDGEALTDPMVAQVVRESACDVSVRGALVGAVYVVDCAPCELWAGCDPDMELLSPDEQLVGDWGKGRCGWLTVGAVRFVEPIPCRGQLGLFEVQVPRDAVIEVVEPPQGFLVDLFTQAHVGDAAERAARRSDVPPQ